MPHQPFRGPFGSSDGRVRRPTRLPANLAARRRDWVYVLVWGAVAWHLSEIGVPSMLLWAFEENRPTRRFYESLGGVLVAENGFELGGAWLSEVAYGWENLDVLLADGSGATGRLPG